MTIDHLPQRASDLLIREPLVIQDLAVAFPDFQLNGISFVLQPGKITGLLGHNGAGKTTTLRLILGLMRKDKGQVSLGGKIFQEQEKAFRERVGFVPDEGYFYNRFTVQELIRFTSSFYTRWNHALCTELMDSLELDPRKRVGDLSKGNRMKLSIVLAFSHDPDVVLMDEPTAGLDPRSRANAMKAMRRMAVEEGRAVLFSTHNLLEVEEIADHMIILDRGKVLADESITEARKHGTQEKAWSLENYYLGLVK